MKELAISNLCGFMNQMYAPNTSIFKDNYFFLHDNFFDINSMFWNNLFSEESVLSLVKKLLDTNKVRQDINLSIKEKIILQNPDQFVTQYRRAKKHLLDVSLTAEEAYSFLEIFEIICMLYTKQISSPFRLNIENGFMCGKYSSSEMFYNCLLPNRNPYWNFINEKVIPTILEIHPKIIWFLGQPNIATFTIARITEQIYPNTFFAICSHSSEFYSMNKIVSLLKQNNILFSLFDCVVLDDSRSTIRKIRNTVSTRGDLSEIPNIIYSLDKGKTISQTPISVNDLQKEAFSVSKLNTQTDFPMNIKLFPQNYCYWKKCNFCGINGKYLFPSSDFWDVKYAIETIHKLYDQGIKNFWLLDEAIPPSILFELSQLIIKQKLKINWHARSRIEKEFMNETICKTLSAAGLKHILFGFESASIRILNLMNKTEMDNYLEVAETIVKEMNNHEISVHFPVIVGYPTETDEERAETYHFLNYMLSNYSLFSYNINIFNLDITSNIFRKWSNYNITDIHFPCAPQYFMENSLEWKCAYLPINNQLLETECANEMHNQYPWYPEDSLLNINIFDMLWENMRGRFRNHSKNNKPLEIQDYNCHYCFNSDVVYLFEDQNCYGMYNYKNHQIVLGGELINTLYKNRKNLTIKDILNLYPPVFKKNIVELINKLYVFNFISKGGECHVQGNT